MSQRRAPTNLNRIARRPRQPASGNDLTAITLAELMKTTSQLGVGPDPPQAVERQTTLALGITRSIRHGPNLCGMTRPRHLVALQRTPRSKPAVRRTGRRPQQTLIRVP